MRGEHLQGLYTNMMVCVQESFSQGPTCTLEQELLVSGLQLRHLCLPCSVEMIQPGLCTSH